MNGIGGMLLGEGVGVAFANFGVALLFLCRPSLFSSLKRPDSTRLEDCCSEDIFADCYLLLGPRVWNIRRTE